MGAPHSTNICVSMKERLLCTNWSCSPYLAHSPPWAALRGSFRALPGRNPGSASGWRCWEPLEGQAACGLPLFPRHSDAASWENSNHTGSPEMQHLPQVCTRSPWQLIFTQRVREKKKIGRRQKPGPQCKGEMFTPQAQLSLPAAECLFCGRLGTQGTAGHPCLCGRA